MKDINPTAWEIDTLAKLSARMHTGGAVADSKSARRVDGHKAELIVFDFETRPYEPSTNVKKHP